jgi:predicted TIM-barrel fold metal-dependent hydrolase
MWGSYFPPISGSLSEIFNQAIGVLASLPDQDRINIFSASATRLFPKFSG